MKLIMLYVEHVNMAIGYEKKKSIRYTLFIILGIILIIAGLYMLYRGLIIEAIVCFGCGTPLIILSKY